MYQGNYTWYAAKELCENNGGRLPEVCSSETNQLLKQLMVAPGTVL